MNYLQQISTLNEWIDITKIETMKVVGNNLIFKLINSEQISYDIGNEEAIKYAKLISGLTKSIPTTRMTEARISYSSDDD